MKNSSLVLAFDLSRKPIQITIRKIDSDDGIVERAKVRQRRGTERKNVAAANADRVGEGGWDQSEPLLHLKCRGVL